MQEQQQQHPPQPLEVGATFTTTRTRPTVVAVITTLLFLVLAVHDYNYRDYPAGEVSINLACLLLLIPAVRAWLRVLRRPVELRLTPAELTMKRGDRELTIPWMTVGQIRIEGDVRRPWVVVWLDPAQTLAGVPASRRRDGAYKIFPVAHGQPMKKRTTQLGQLRGAIVGYGRRYLDPGF
jgi:hypothetical protein